MGFTSYILVVFSNIVIDHIWGDWAVSVDSCPVGEIAIGFMTNVDNFGNPDETGMNGLKLLCSGNTSVTSDVGQWGAWASAYEYCPHGYDQAQARVQVLLVLIALL